MTGLSPKTVNLFCSYAREDEDLFQGLYKQFGGLLREGLVSLHHSRDLLPGAEANLEIGRMLKSADLILLFVSANFLNSDDCYNRDMRLALQERQATGKPIIPIILRPCYWSDTPFAQFKPLPEDTRPVTHWGHYDDAFLDITHSLLKLIREVQQTRTVASDETTAIDITRVSAGSMAYFTEYFVGGGKIPHRFPTESDFANKLVYLSRDYAEKVEQYLHANRRAVLVGLAASGKTVFALAFAKELQHVHHYRIAYKDVSSASRGDGQQWYEVMHAPRRENTLYILDNCHLAEEEVVAFCNQWNSNPPLQAQCLLLSRAEPQQIRHLLSSQDNAEQGEEYFSYLELWRDEIVFMQAERAYMEIIKQHFDAYKLQDARLYEDPSHDDLLALKRQHAHSLFTSHFRLNAWKKRGGLLSKVRQEDIYTSIYERYLENRDVAVTHTLPLLCALRAFEIPVHSNFIKTLPPQEIQYLDRSDLLADRREELYGRLYTLTIHPEEARLIFEASLANSTAVTPKAIEDGLFTALRTYLLTMPRNYLEVYARLCRYRQRVLLQRLLTDGQLQAQAEQQFTQERLISDESVGTISKIVEYMRGAQYDAVQVQRFIEALDIEQIIQHALRQKRSSPQQLFWLLRSLQRISPLVAARFMEGLPPATLAQLCLQQKPAIALIGQFSKVIPTFWQSLLQSIGAQELAAIYNRSPLGAVGTFLRYHYGHIVVQQSFPIFEETFLKGKLVRSPLSEIGKYLHRVRTISTQGVAPARPAVRLLLTVDLTERIISTDLEPFVLLLHELASLDARHVAQFLQPLYIPEITQVALARSGLRGIQLLIRAVARIDAGVLPAILQGLRTLSLQEKVTTTPLLDCSYFLWNVYALLEPQLAQDYCELLDERRSVQLLTETPLEHLCHFLLNLYSLSGQSLLHTFAEPALEERLQQAWELDAGYATVLLGLLFLTLPEQQHPLPSLQTQEQQHQLADWLGSPTDQRAYMLALTIHGLRRWNEQEAQQLLRRYLSYPKAMQVFNHARKTARAPRSIALLENEQQWLVQVWKTFS